MALQIPYSLQPPDEEAALVQGIEEGDPQAIEDFILRCQRAVFALSCRFCEDPELRWDWTHDTLLRLIEEIGSGRFVYQRPGCLWAWFRKRAYYLLLNQLERQRRLQKWELRTEIPELPCDLSGRSACCPAVELERAETRHALADAFERLPSKNQKRALLLLLDQELSYEEIALAMGAPLNTVRSWIRRGRLALRRDLSRCPGLGA